MCWNRKAVRAHGILERLNQTILDVIDKPEKTQQTTAIGTLF